MRRCHTVLAPIFDDSTYLHMHGPVALDWLGAVVLSEGEPEASGVTNAFARGGYARADANVPQLPRLCCFLHPAETRTVAVGAIITIKR